MKKLLVILGILLSFGASAQTMVYDTTVVKSPLGVIVTGGAVKDSLYIQSATASRDGYMTATAMSQLDALVGGAVAYPTSGSQAGTSYTVQTSDFNKLISMSNTAGTISVVIPTGLPNGWSCRIMQGGGTITFTAASGATIRSISSWKRSSGQYGVVTITALGSNTYSLSGNLKQ
jgi:hypothetical protein